MTWNAWPFLIILLLFMPRLQVETKEFEKGNKMQMWSPFISSSFSIFSNYLIIKWFVLKFV